MDGILHKIAQVGSTDLKVIFCKELLPYRDFIELVYDKEKSYGVTGIKYDYAVDKCTIVQMPDQAFYDSLTRLETRRVTGNAAKTLVGELRRSYGHLIDMVLCKSLFCGASVKTLEKAGFNFIQFKIAKGDKRTTGLRKYPGWAQTKYDGFRCVATITNGSVIFKTSSGRPFNIQWLSDYILDYYSRIGLEDGIVLDGELVCGEGGIEDRKDAVGILNQVLKSGYQVPKDTMTFAVFDHLPLPHFEAQKCDIPYMHRHSCIPTDIPRVKRVENIEVRNAQELEEAYHKIVEQGGEGVMYKSPAHFYNYKRSLEWEKLKPDDSADLKVIGYIPGEGRFKGYMGALRVQGMVGDKLVTTKVGTGFSFAIRSVPEEDWIGRTVEVKYMHITESEGQYSLYAPRFMRFRPDKD